VDEQEALDRILIAMYLDSNARHHCARSPHSWPCGIWEASAMATKNLSWKDLYEHGLVPPNWRILTEDPYG
jgi:hypothetical protein